MRQYHVGKIKNENNRGKKKEALLQILSRMYTVHVNFTAYYNYNLAYSGVLLQEFGREEFR